MPSHITLDQLITHNACADQVALFRKHFPTNQASVTPAACLTLAEVFDFGWAAEHLLTTTAWSQYDVAVAPARAQYDAVHTAAWAQYSAACAPERAQYDAAVTPARAQYDAAVAVAFADTYLSQE
jgi:hypothetical protein